MIRKSIKKTDHNDVRGFALFLSRDMLPETRPYSAGYGSAWADIVVQGPTSATLIR